jgi:hypothetical protein
MRTNSVALLLLLAVCPVDAALTNVPPPFSTNAPGLYLLEHPWLGESRAVVRSGVLATWTNSPKVEKLETDLRFDLFIVRDESSADPPGLIVARHPGQLVIAESRGSSTGYTMPHVYRGRLPSNVEIQTCSTVPKLTELLGAPHEADGAPYSTFWRFFTFTSTDTIEAVSVVCVGQWKGHIDGIAIRRGTIKRSR